jgi:putative spermidine/putrescine transport system ATP-binding protein
MRRNGGRATTVPPAGTHAEDLVVSGLTKAYQDGVPVLSALDFRVPAGEFHALLGPSGSGKTTLLRVIAGFTPADTGRILVGTRDVTRVPAEKRNTGVVFQNYALFPHMTVGQNVAFGLRMRGYGRNEVQDRVHDCLELVGMRGLERRRPSELSGGQQQRVALARALVIEPDLLLLDEPLSALDRKIRQSVRAELKRIQAETGVTTIIVTHDQEEALYLADKVFVLESGKIRQSGTPAELYRNPSDSFVAGFVGELNRVSGVLEREEGVCAVSWGTTRLAVPAALVSGIGSGAQVELRVRPEDVLATPTGEDAVTPDAGRIVDVEFSGPVVTLHVELSGQRIQCLRLSPTVIDEPGYAVGDQVAVSLHHRGVRLEPLSEERVQ